MEISDELGRYLQYLGILPTDSDDSVRSANVGASDYSSHIIQSWTIWDEYGLNPKDADIVKRVLRTKDDSERSPIENRILDYQKIVHIGQERIRQLEILNKSAQEEVLANKKPISPRGKDYNLYYKSVNYYARKYNKGDKEWDS